MNTVQKEKIEKEKKRERFTSQFKKTLESEFQFSSEKTTSLLRSTVPFYEVANTKGMIFPTNGEVIKKLVWEVVNKENKIDKIFSVPSYKVFDEMPTEYFNDMLEYLDEELHIFD